MILFLILAIENDEDRQLMLRIFQEFYPVMKARAFKYTNSHENAGDIVQDAIVRLIAKVPELHRLNKYQIATYVYKTVSSTAIDNLRKNSKYVDIAELEHDAMDIDDGALPVEDEYERIESYENMAKHLSKLSPKEKDLLYYKYFLDFPDKEIAKIMGMEHGAVRTSLSRLRNKVKALLIKGGEIYGHSK